MFSGAIFAACGPGLIALQSAVALFFVHSRLSRVRHAIVWALAFLALAIQWMLFAASNLGQDSYVLTAISALAGVAGLLLFVEGYHIRARGKWPSPRRLLFGAAVLLAMMAATLAESVLWVGVVLPLLSCLLLLLAAREVVPPRKRANAAELISIWLLVVHAAIKLAIALTAFMEMTPLVRATIRAASWMPVGAMMGLFALLLIASDFSVELRRLLHTDPLTGVLNRAGFEERARALLGRSRARPITVAVADIDRFKHVNDRFGHAAGDAALACVAEHLQSLAGSRDMVGRIGGEEFAILFWDTDGQHALNRIEPVRTGLALADVAGHPEVRVTASFGIAERVYDAESLLGMIERADAALYRSKREGRDRSTLAEALAGAA
jgi:diguanylate cyclase (GGDEF)-like protein